MFPFLLISLFRYIKAIISHAKIFGNRKTKSSAKNPGRNLPGLRFMDFNAILTDTDPCVLPEQALCVTKILEAIYESAKTGKAVYFED